MYIYIQYKYIQYIYISVSSSCLSTFALVLLGLHSTSSTAKVPTTSLPSQLPARRRYSRVPFESLGTSRSARPSLVSKPRSTIRDEILFHGERSLGSPILEQTSKPPRSCWSKAKQLSSEAHVAASRKRNGCEETNGRPINWMHVEKQITLAGTA